jgi:hypothetical protein
MYPGPAARCAVEGGHVRPVAVQVLGCPPREGAGSS